MTQANLNPKEQQVLFDLMKKSGQQPTAGGMPQTTPDPGATAFDPQQAPQPPAPGSFANDPQGAIKHLMSLATGPQVTKSATGQLQTSVPTDQPLLRLFGVKQKVPIEDPNYLEAARAAGLDKFLPSGLARTPDGMPFVSGKALDNARELKNIKTAGADEVPITDPGTLGFARAFVQARAPETLDSFDQMVKTGSFTKKMLSQLPSFVTGRQDFFSPQGFYPTASGFKGVAYNSARDKWSVQDLPTDGNLPGKPRVASSEEADFFAKAETLNTVMGQVAKLYSDDKVGPFAGRVGRAIDTYTPFTDSERSSLRNYTAKMFNNMIYLRSGKQINQEEANRMGEEFMNINNTPGAFKTAFDSLQNEMVWLVDNKRQALRQGMVVNADKFAPSVQPDQRVQLNGTPTVDNFLSGYDAAHNTSYTTTVKQDIDGTVQYLKDRRAKITPKNLAWAKAQLASQQGTK